MMDKGKIKLISRCLWAVALALAVWAGSSYLLAGPPQTVEREPLTLSGGADLPALDLNEATLAELDELPGIGPALAQRILDWREENGPFTDRSDVLAVSGIGPAIYEAIEPFITY